LTLKKQTRDFEVTALN